MKFVKRNTTKGSEGGNLTINTGGYSSSSSNSSLTLTSHNIWGQPFDGTNDVTGDMQNVGSITATGNIQTDRDIIIKQLDTDGNEVDGGDLNISVEGDSASFSGKDKYIFNGDLEGKNVKADGDLNVTGTGNVNNLKVSGDATFNSNIEVKGDSNLNNIISNNITNSDTIKTKNLEVTGSAHFFELIIDKIKSAGGAALFTPADGFDIDVVESISGGYKLYWQCRDGNGNQRDNMWKVNDQALCMSFNQAKVGTSHNVSNKYYWCLVTDVSDNSNPTLIDGEYYHYIVISSNVCDGTVNPEKGDSIVMCGYRGTDDTSRQSAIYISAYSSIDSDLTAPLFAQYQGVNDFNLSSHRKSYFDANKAKFVGDFVAESSNKNLVDLIDDVNNQVTTNKTDIANLTVKADGIESTVSSMSNGSGTNLFSFTNANFNDFNCMSAIQMNGFYTLNKYRITNLGTNGVTGDYVVSFDARVLKDGTVINVNFSGSNAVENKGNITFTTEFKHYILHYKDVKSTFLEVYPYNGFISFDPIVHDKTNQLYVANFMLERGTIPSSNFSSSIADRNNYTSNKVFTDFEPAPTATLVDAEINGNKVKAYRQGSLPADTEYVDILSADNLQKKFKIEPWKVYTLSFWAKILRGGNGHLISMYLYPIIAITGQQRIQYKDINGPGTQSAYSASTDGFTSCELDSKWRKFYVHWQPHQVGETVSCICGRKNKDEKAIVFIAEPKLEEGYICEDNRFNQDTYSSIKQTANEIRQQVGDSYTSLKNGNFTIGANTKILGNLNMTGTENKITVVNDDNSQITQIQPVSIGSWSSLQSQSTINLPLYKTNNYSFITDQYGHISKEQLSDTTGNLKVTEYFDVGDFVKNDSIEFQLNHCHRLNEYGNEVSQFSCKFDIYSISDTGTMTLLKTANSGDYFTLTLTDDGTIRVKVSVTIILPTLENFTPNSFAALTYKLGFNAIIGDKGKLITTVGYDGISGSLGNGKCI